MTEKRSRNYHDHKRWKKNYLKLHRLRKKPVTDPLREEVTAIPCHELLSSISLRTSIILEREQGVSIKGKNIRYSNGRTPNKSLSYSSPLDYELSLLFGSACRASPKTVKKNCVNCILKSSRGKAQLYSNDYFISTEDERKRATYPYCCLRCSSALSQHVLKWTHYGSPRCEHFGLSIQIAF